MYSSRKTCAGLLTRNGQRALEKRAGAAALLAGVGVPRGVVGRVLLRGVCGRSGVFSATSHRIYVDEQGAREFVARSGHPTNQKCSGDTWA